MELFKDTFTLMQAMDRMKQPSSFLVDTFFPVVPATAVTSKIAVEYRKGARKLAPFVIPGGNGVNTSRIGSKIDFYEPPMMGPRRVLGVDELMQRSFGEDIYSTKTPEQRANEILARDLVDLQNMVVNRKNKMAADILLTGQCQIDGYGADGKVTKTDVLKFEDWTQKLEPTTKWDQANADIYGDLAEMSNSIQENAGIVPDVAICGKNIMNYILGNEAIMKYIAIPNANNLSMMSFQPRLRAPQIMYIGTIMSLNLELYSYMETGPFSDIMSRLNLKTSVSLFRVSSRAALYEMVRYTDAYYLNSDYHRCNFFKQYQYDEIEYLPRRALMLKDSNVQSIIGWLSRSKETLTPIQQEMVEMLYDSLSFD